MENVRNVANNTSGFNNSTGKNEHPVQETVLSPRPAEVIDDTVPQQFYQEQYYDYESEVLMSQKDNRVVASNYTPMKDTSTMGYLYMRNFHWGSQLREAALQEA